MSKVKAEKSKPEKQSVISEIYDYLEIFVIAACVVLLLFTLSIRLCRVDGDSMYDTLENGQLLFVNDIFYKPDSGDIIVFHQSDNKIEDLNKPLVKRVIATEGKFVKIEYVRNDDNGLFTMKLYVSNDDTFTDDERVDESYLDFSVINKYAANRYGYSSAVAQYGYPSASSGIISGAASSGYFTYTAQVPQGKLFVMGDNRFASNDSRLDVGFVDTRCVLGKVLFRITPPGSVY